MAVNYRQIKAIEQKNKKRILEVAPNTPDTAGIYVFTRTDGDFKYAYVGQAKHLLSRLAQHLSGYQHIDLSIKKHGLWSEENPQGWKVSSTECEANRLDEWEIHFIKAYANQGYQMRNKTSGGQDKGKKDIAERQAPKGYREGVKQGKKNVLKEIKHLFDLHLVVDVKKQGNKVQLKALEKFKEMLNGIK